MLGAFVCKVIFLEADKDLKEAMEECAKVLEKKCGKRPYMIVVSKANLYFKTPQDKAAGKMSGTASYMYMAKPELKRDGLSKLLVDTSKLALELAEKELDEKAE